MTAKDQVPTLNEVLVLIEQAMEHIEETDDEDEVPTELRYAHTKLTKAEATLRKSIAAALSQPGAGEVPAGVREALESIARMYGDAAASDTPQFKLACQCASEAAQHALASLGGKETSCSSESGPSSATSSSSPSSSAGSTPSPSPTSPSVDAGPYRVMENPERGWFFVMHHDGSFSSGVIPEAHDAASIAAELNRLARSDARVRAGIVSFNAEPWEDGEYVITANGSPIGQPMPASARSTIVAWVASAWADLIKINAKALSGEGSVG